MANVPRVAIASSDDYVDAQRSVDSLADKGFPVERLAIVGLDLETIEQVTGRRTYLTTAGVSAISGGLLGALLGFLLGLFSLVEPLVSAIALAFWGFVLGAVVGGVLGVVSYAASGGRRDFHSVAHARARRYEVMCDPDAADEARELLRGSSAIATSH